MPVDATGSRPSLDGSRANDARSRAVLWWHALLRANAVLSLALLLTAAEMARHTGNNDAAARLQLLLCGLYVLGCAFRSALPVYDIPRIVLVDSPLSGVVVGRSVATVAELCFASQWALMLHSLGASAHSQFGEVVSLAIVPLIVLAETWSWYSVLTTRQRGHAIENSLWGFSAALMVAGLLVIGPRRFADLYPVTLAWCVGGAAYIAFIFLVDVPMYWSRWLADQASGRPYLSIAQGVVDVCRRRSVSYRWEDWRNEMQWMSLYFTLGVWSSLSLVYAAMALGATGY
jgi:hypothetical protein